MRLFLVMLLGTAFVSGCGAAPDLTSLNPERSSPDADGVVVKGRATFNVIVGEESARMALASATATQPITVTVNASTTMTASNAGFAAPATITNEVLSFGSLQITSLKDNNIKVCGTNGNQRCGKALIRMYTTGQTGAGLWNATDGYGAPILAGIEGATPGTVGLGTAGATVLQSYTVASGKNVIQLSDFGPAQSYGVKVDFSNAGAGTYQTTLVLEYALAP